MVRFLAFLACLSLCACSSYMRVQQHDLRPDRNALVLVVHAEGTGGDEFLAKIAEQPQSTDPDHEFAYWAVAGEINGRPILMLHDREASYFQLLTDEARRPGSPHLQSLSELLAGLEGKTEVERADLGNARAIVDEFGR